MSDMRDVWVTFRRVVVKDRGGLGRQGFGEDRLLVAVREQRRAEGRIGLQVTLLQHRPHMRSPERIWFWRGCWGWCCCRLPRQPNAQPRIGTRRMLSRSISNKKMLGNVYLQ